MQTYKTQEEVMADVVNGVLKVADDVTFECDIDMPDVSINAGNINANNITADSINACDINAGNITAGNITAGNINACNIDACNINACNINACNIKARDIEYYAFCIAYAKIVCRSIVGRRHNSKHFCLDSEIMIREKQ